MPTHRLLLNPADGLIYATNGGMALGLPIAGPGPQSPTVNTGWPRATVTFSGVTIRTVCCVATVAAKVNSEATATNGAHCLDRTGATDWGLTETNGITLGVGVGACGSGQTASPVTTLSFCDGVWTLRRYAFENSVTSRFYLIFEGTSTDGCFPMTFTNTLVACADDGAAFGGGTRGPNLGSGGTATLEWACCGVSTTPTAFNPATESNVSDVRDCCEIFEVTIGGGTIFDGLWRIAKSQGSQIGTTFRWSTSRYNGYGVVIKKNVATNRWNLVAESDLDSTGSPCIYTWEGPSLAECPGTEWTYAGRTGSCAAVDATLSVVKRNCWDGSRL